MSIDNDEVGLVNAVMDAEKAEDEKTIWPSHITLTDNPNTRYVICGTCLGIAHIEYNAEHIAKEREFIQNHLHK